MPTSPVEYPCGRTALADVSDSSMRSLLGLGNSSLQDNVTLVNGSDFTTPLPSTTAATTTAAPPPPTNKSTESNLLHEEAVFRPVEAPQNQLTRIVGGEVVIPGEIPWQVITVARLKSKSQVDPHIFFFFLFQ